MSVEFPNQWWDCDNVGAKCSLILSSANKLIFEDYLTNWISKAFEQTDSSTTILLWRGTKKCSLWLMKQSTKPGAKTICSDFTHSLSLHIVGINYDMTETRNMRHTSPNSTWFPWVKPRTKSPKQISHNVSRYPPRHILMYKLLKSRAWNRAFV